MWRKRFSCLGKHFIIQKFNTLQGFDLESVEPISPPYGPDPNFKDEELDLLKEDTDEDENDRERGHEQEDKNMLV